MDFGLPVKNNSMANLEQGDDDPKNVNMSTEVSVSSLTATSRPTTGRAGDSGTLHCLIPSFANACQLVSAPYSCLVTDLHRRHIALPPMYLNKKKTGIQEELNTELLRYSESLSGVPLAYDDIRIQGHHGSIYDDSGYIHLNVEANFVVFKPEKGNRLRGVVNKLGMGHVGCLVHGCFNASVPRPNNVSVDTWGKLGPRIGSVLEFEVSQLDADTVGVLLIRGRMMRTSVQELLARAEDAGSSFSTDPQGEPDVEPAPEPAQDQPVDAPKPKKKSKKDKHTEGETVVSHSLGVVSQEANGSAEGANGQVGEAKKKKKKKDKHVEKEEEEEEETSPLYLHNSDSSGYLSDKSSRKRKQEAAEDVLSRLDINAETPIAKKKRKSNVH